MDGHRGARASPFTGTGWVWHTQLKEEFLPNFKERDFLMHWLEKPNTSVEASKRITIAAAQGSACQCPACATRARTSAAPKSRMKWSALTSPNCGSASIRRWITTARFKKVQAVVDGYPGLTRDLLTFLRERIKEVLTGASASIVVRIFGPDLDTLRTHAAEVGDAAQRRARGQRPEGRAASARAADHRETAA